MSDHEFVFALELSDEPRFERMLVDLTWAVLSHVGYPAPAAKELHGVLRNALKSGHASGRTHCDVCFRARSGELHISVAYEGGAEWQTSRPLP